MPGRTRRAAREPQQGQVREPDDRPEEPQQDQARQFKADIELIVQKQLDGGTELAEALHDWLLRSPPGEVLSLFGGVLYSLALEREPWMKVLAAIAKILGTRWKAAGGPALPSQSTLEFHLIEILQGAFETSLRKNETNEESRHNMLRFMFELHKISFCVSHRILSTVCMTLTDVTTESWMILEKAKAVVFLGDLFMEDPPRFGERAMITFWTLVGSFFYRTMKVITVLNDEDLKEKLHNKINTWRSFNRDKCLPDWEPRTMAIQIRDTAKELSELRARRGDLARGRAQLAQELKELDATNQRLFEEVKQLKARRDQRDEARLASLEALLR